MVLGALVYRSLVWCSIPQTGHITHSPTPETRSRLKSGNACCHLVQNILCFSLLSKNIKIKIYRTIIFPVVLYGCETWSITVTEAEGV